MGVVRVRQLNEHVLKTHQGGMIRLLTFAAVFPPGAMLVFMSPDIVSKGIPASDDLLAWLIASLYAASDELHQAFVPNRTARWADVGLDSFGAAVGAVTLYYFGRWRKYW